MRTSLWKPSLLYPSTEPINILFDTHITNRAKKPPFTGKPTKSLFINGTYLASYAEDTTWKKSTMPTSTWKPTIFSAPKPHKMRSTGMHSANTPNIFTICKREKTLARLSIGTKLPRTQTSSSIPRKT